MDLGSTPWIWTMVLALLVYVSAWPLGRLPGGDSGELLAEACVGGVAHPPGYPLLLALLRFAHRIARSYPAVSGESVRFVHAANALNALIAAAAAACVSHTVYLLSKRRFGIEAVAAGLLFALSKLTWEYAHGLEVFALNNLLVGILHILVVRHFMHATRINACMGAFVCGLGLANQHTIVLFEAPFILWVLSTYHFRLSELLRIALAFLAGLSIYLHTVWSALEPTPGSWGNASTFSGLLAHMRRKEYGTFRLSPLHGDSESLPTRLGIYFMDCVADFHWTGIVLAFVGITTLLFPQQLHSNTFKKMPVWTRSVGYAQVSALVCYLLVFHSLANLPLDAPMPRAISSRFNMQPNTVLAIWLGLGLVGLTHFITSQFIPQANRSETLIRILRTSICVAIVAAQYQRNRPTGDAPTYGDAIRAHGDAIFNVMPQDAVLLSYTDINWNSLRYLQTCEGIRPDVTHLSLQLLPFPWFTRQHKMYPSVAFPRIRRDVSTTKSSEGYARFLHDFLAANMARHGDRLFLDLHAVNDHDIASNGQYLGFSLSPHGLVWKVNPPPPTAAGAEALYSLWEATPSPPAFVAAPAFPPGSWEFAAAIIANDARYQGALYALSYWLDRARTIRHANEVAAYVLGLHRIVELLTEVDALASNSEAWGLTYEAYDLAKNAGLAAMRLQAGIELIAPRMPALMEQHRRSDGSQEARAKLQELMELVERADVIRVQARQRIDPLLVEMRARSDLDTQAFADFMATKAPTRRAKKPKKKKRKRSH